MFGRRRFPPFPFVYADFYPPTVPVAVVWRTQALAGLLTSAVWAAHKHPSAWTRSSGPPDQQCALRLKIKIPLGCHPHLAAGQVWQLPGEAHQYQQACADASYNSAAASSVCLYHRWVRKLSSPFRHRSLWLLSPPLCYFMLCDFRKQTNAPWSPQVTPRSRLRSRFQLSSVGVERSAVDTLLLPHTAILYSLSLPLSDFLHKGGVQVLYVERNKYYHDSSPLSNLWDNLMLICHKC